MPPDADNGTAGASGGGGQGTGDAAAAAAAEAAAVAASEAAASGGFMAGLVGDDVQFAKTKGWDKRGLPGIFQDYRNLEGKVGPDTVKLPGKDAKPEDLDKFYGALGRPAEATGEKGYQFAAAEGIEVDKNMDGWYRGAAHKHRLTEAQAAGLFADWNESQQISVKEALAADEKTVAALKAEKGDGYDAFIAGAKQAVSEFVPKGADGTADSEILDRLEKTLKVGPLLRLWGTIGEKISNFRSLDLGGDGIANLPGNAAAAQAEIKKIREARAADPKHPLNDNRSPGYREAADRWGALIKIANPEKASG